MVANKITQLFDEDDEDSVEAPIIPLAKDIMSASKLLTREEGRFLVDLYYEMQDYRIRAANQRRSTIESGEPNKLLLWAFDNTKTTENKLKSALGMWAAEHTVGQWAQSICGIGPVLSAGLIAHINIEKSPTPGHIWRFAGLDPTVEWNGTSAAKELVDSAFQVEQTPAGAIWWLSEATHRHTNKVFIDAGAKAVPDRTTALQVVQNLAQASPSEVREVFDAFPLETDNAIRHSCMEFQIHPTQVYADLYPNFKPDRKALAKALARRPWNARLKVLCYKIGESFVKVQNNKNDIYGKMFAERKAEERERNDRLEFADQAAAALKKKNYGSDTIARAAYESGKLPDAQIHARARRHAVKMFLAHWHHVAYESHFNMAPPRPYVIEHLGHAHYIAPPNWPME